ncbi:MAG: rRNA maturation RNase YbeY [Bacilli bacterium]|nr:rRNA maturation RNase YbeY [Bacilli bacterium]
MNSIGIFNETEEKIEELKTIKKLIQFALKKENIKRAILNIIIIDNESIKEINRQYRNIDRETDVISFALEDSKELMPDGYRLLGDIYISIDKAKEQAVNYEHSFLRELSFLSIHGFLHLLGYDHMVKEEEEIMFKKQEDILNDFGITRK